MAAITLIGMRQIHCARQTMIAAFFSLLLAPAQALAVPVYLSPDSPYPTGHYSREWLENRTKNRITQRWVKVRARDGKVGWVAEDHVLTQLLLSTHARLQSGASLRAEMLSDSREIGKLPPGARVRLLARNGRWFEVQPEGVRLTGFLPADALRPDHDAPSMAFAKVTTTAFEQATIRSETQFTLREGERAEVLRGDSTWILVRLRSKTGYIARRSLLLRDEVGPNFVLSLKEGQPLRSDTHPLSSIVGRSTKLEPLRLIGARIENWGLVSARDGDLWWPMNAKADEKPSVRQKLVKLKTKELFKRSVFDMAESPKRPKLKLISAGGIFRTEDGQIWTRIDLFKNENHPISISPSGRIFVGPYASDDNGQTFQEYIRWDHLIRTIRNRWEPSAHNLRIIDVTADKADGRIKLKLDIGMKNSIVVATDDAGQSWSTR